MTWKHICSYQPYWLLLDTPWHSLAVEVPGAALVGSPAHPPLHHRHLVHLGRRQAGVQALLAGDGAKARCATAGSARPEGELATATLPVWSAEAVFTCLCSFLISVMCRDTCVMCL